LFSDDVGQDEADNKCQGHANNAQELSLDQLLRRQVTVFPDNVRGLSCLDKRKVLAIEAQPV